MVTKDNSLVMIKSDTNLVNENSFGHRSARGADKGDSCEKYQKHYGTVSGNLNTNLPNSGNVSDFLTADKNSLTGLSGYLKTQNWAEAQKNANSSGASTNIDKSKTFLKQYSNIDDSTIGILKNRKSNIGHLSGAVERN